jgi:hypothetical protein
VAQTIARPPPARDRRDQLPSRPGRDHPVSPDGDHLCSSRACTIAGLPAEIIVTFGALADPDTGSHGEDVLWASAWGRSYPMCAPCWATPRQVAREHRPNLVISDIGSTGA